MRDTLLFLLLALFHMQALSQSKSEKLQLFDTQELIAQQEQSQKRYLPFIDQPTISAGIYELKAGETDQQQPHTMDELYFILSGASDFTVEDKTTTVKPGDVLFVRATLDHKFSNITENLKILVWFSGSPRTDHDFDWKKWSAHELTTRTSSENAWNDFLKVPSLTAGLYQLPEKLGGDSVLTHQKDEINYVIKGKAKFQVGEEVIDVYPGSIFWVNAGTGHKFFDLEKDLEVYIMFVIND